LYKIKNNKKIVPVRRPVEKQNGNLYKVFVTRRFDLEAKMQTLMFFSVGAYRN